MKCFYIDTISYNNRSVKVLLSGTWDGEKFVHVDSKGLKTVVRKKSWLFTLKEI